MNPVLEEVNDIIDEEIKYLSSFYTYNIKDFRDPKLLHARSMLVFMDPILRDSPSDKQPDNFFSRLINLMAGIELLATGLNLHTFNIYDLAEMVSTGNAGGKNNRSNPAEKNYTVDLLFGDVFYARAVIYILGYGDFFIFNSILDSLKRAHKSRLNLHRRLMEDLKVNGDKFNDPDDTGVNSLLKTSFFIGWGVFFKDEKVKLPYEIINDFVSLKTLNDICHFFDGFPEKSSLPEKKSFIGEKSRSIKDGLVTRMEDLELAYVRDNFKDLQDLY